MSNIGRNIKNLRKARAMSQETLAEKLYVTRQAVSQWETGRTQPDLTMLEKIADSFGTDLLTILYGEHREMKKSDPPALHRKKYQKGFLLFGTLSLMMLLLLLILRPTIEYWYYRLLAEPFVELYMAFAAPLLYLFAALFAANGVSLGWDLHIRAKPLRLAVLAASIAFLVLYGLLSLLWIGKVISGVGIPQRVWMFLQSSPAWFLLPGLGIHFGKKVTPDP